MGLATGYRDRDEDELFVEGLALVGNPSAYQKEAIRSDEDIPDGPSKALRSALADDYVELRGWTPEQANAAVADMSQFKVFDQQAELAKLRRALSYAARRSDTPEPAMGKKTSPSSSSSDGRAAAALPLVRTQADYDALEVGEVYRKANGSTATKDQ